MNVCEVIAEIGSVHDGSFGNALKLIEAAAAAGANVVKFQTHLAEAETLRNAPSPPYFRGEPRFDYFRRISFTLEQWRHLNRHCQELGVEFISSPFSNEAVDLLEEVGVRRYKIGSGEVSNLPLLEQVARTGKKVILSSGMSSWEELDRAVGVFRRAGNDLTVLQCTSQYPCPYEEIGLNIMQEMAARYRCPVGLSDHSLTNYAAYGAVMLGAAAVEKHFTFSRLMYGSDAAHSLEPHEFSELVRGVRALEILRAHPVDKDRTAGRLQPMKQIFEKSIVSLRPIPAGAVITPDMIGVKKPGTGIPARRLGEIIGRRTARAVPEDTLLAEEDLHA